MADMVEMDEIHLSGEEIDYELMIRNYYLLEVPGRAKTGRLRELLVKESVGIEPKPGKDSSPLTSEQDIEKCRGICTEISNALNNEKTELSDRRALFLRATHVRERLQRIKPKTAVELEKLQRLQKIAQESLQQIRSQIPRPQNAGVLTGTNKVQPQVRFDIPKLPDRSLNRPQMGDQGRNSLPNTSTVQQAS